MLVFRVHAVSQRECGGDHCWETAREWDAESLQFSIPSFLKKKGFPSQCIYVKILKPLTQASWINLVKSHLLKWVGFENFWVCYYIFHLRSGNMSIWKWGQELWRVGGIWGRDSSKWVVPTRLIVSDGGGQWSSWRIR